MIFRFPCRLYPIIDTLGDPQRTHVALAEAVLQAGVPLLQLRIKDEPTGRFVELARCVQGLAERHGARLIINDRADVAQLVGAAGVHLGQDDLPVDAARQILGAQKLIGLSTHNLAQAEAAARQGIADYIGFGPIFPTTSKQPPDPVVGLAGLSDVRSRVGIAIVAIGGITAATLPSLLSAGADAAAVIGAIVATPAPRVATEQLLQLCASV
jgi:thiamine-phosphate pyrophosphorylase